MKTVVLILMALVSLAPQAGASLDDSPAPTCSTLINVDFTGIQDAPTQLTQALLVEAASDAPGYCRIEGYVAPQVGFEVRLPVADWNGKFLMLGGGGWGGRANGAGCNGYLRRGYACLVSDTGHRGSGGDGLWAQNNLPAQVDFGYRSVHVSALAGKAIVERFYAKAPQRAYFLGCSTGGYQGLVEAQRFPWDFDGIVAGSPDMDEADLTMRELWNAKTFAPKGGPPILSGDDIYLLHRSVLAACDEDDGVKDGIIGNPFACKFKPANLLCSTSKRERCLTSAQVDAVKRLYEGPSNSAGLPISTGGVLAGSELTWGDRFGGFNGEGMLEYADSLFRYMIYGANPDWRAKDFDFDRDYKRIGLAALFNDTNPDLRKFKSAGGKLIVYQGANDILEVPNAIVDYYKTVERTMGGRESTSGFFRLFVVPGMGHCTGGEGAYAIDYLSYLEAWTEKQRAPDKMIGAHVSDEYLAALSTAAWENELPSDVTLTRELKIAVGASNLLIPLDPAIPVAFTRPVFPYPLSAKYRGKGDPNDEKNFVAVQE